MEIGAYAFNAGPAKMLGMLKGPAEARSHTFFQPSSLRDLYAEETHHLIESDVAFFGVSIPKVEEGIRIARERISRQLPTIFMEDASDVDHILGDYFDAEHFPSRIVAMSNRLKRKRDSYFGPPNHWADSYQAMVDAPKRAHELRKTKDGEQEHLLDADDTIVCIPGIKGNPEVMNDMVDRVSRVAEKELGQDLVLAVNQHPGEVHEASLPVLESRYRHAFAERKRLLGDKWHLPDWLVNEPGRKLSNPELVGLADITVLTGKPTEGIVIGFTGKPHIFDNTPMSKIMGNDKTPWFMRTYPGVIDVRKSDEMQKAMQVIRTNSYRRYARLELARLFPVPQDWNTSERIIEALPQLIQPRR